MAENADIYFFGDCELDPGRREFRRAGEAVDVQRKVFDLLVYLLEHRDRAVDKEEIQEAVWPGVIVTETALTRAIMKARRAVGDDADSQSILRTVHGHGYRFVAEVRSRPVAGAAESVPEAPAPSTAPGPQSVSRDQADRRKWHVGAMVAVLLVALVGAFLTLAPDSADRQERRLAILPVDNSTGDPEVDWARLGMMGVVGQMLRTAGVAVVPSSQVLSVAERDLPAADLDERLRRAYGATDVVAARLETAGGLYRLTWEMRGGDARPIHRTLVGNDIARLGRDFGADLLSSAAPGHDLPRHEVSDDPFVNEAYARGLSLQLQGKAREARPLFAAAASQAPGAFWPRYEYAVSLRILGENDEARGVLEEVLAAARQADDPAEQSAALNALALLDWREGATDVAEGRLTEGLPLALKSGDLVAAGTMLVNMAILARNRGELAQGLSYLDRSEALFKEAGYADAPGSLYNTRATILDTQGRMAEADAAFSAALAAFRAEGQERHEATVLRNLSGVRFQQGRWEDAEAFGRAGLTLREALGDKRGQASSLEGLAELELARGRITMAWQHAEQALELARATSTRSIQARALGRLGDVHRERGEHDEARARYLEAREMAEAAGNVSAVMGRDLDIASVELDVQDPAAAAAAAERVAEQARALGLEAWSARATVTLGRALLAQGEEDAAEACFADALQLGQRLGEPDVEAAAAAALAERHLAGGEPAQARPLVERYAELRPQAGDRWMLEAHLAMSEGDPVGALERMERAREAFAERWGDEEQVELDALRKAAGQAGNTT